MTGHPMLWIPAGDWASWVGSALAGGSLIGLVVGLHNERTARHTNETLAKSEQRQFQARRVGAWIEPLDRRAGNIWQFNVANASQLPIRTVHGYVFSNGGDPVGSFLPISVVPPNRTSDERLEVAGDLRVLTLVYTFVDETGIRWRKHLRNDLEELLPGQGDLEILAGD